MQRRWTGLAVALACGFVFAIPTSALAQTIGEGRIIRSPGDMVNDGLVRAQSAVRDPLATPQITETQAPQSSGDLFSAAALDAFVRMFEELFVFFGNRMLVQAGLPPLFTIDLAPPPSGSDGSADGTSTGDGTDVTGTGDGTIDDGTGTSDGTDGTGSTDTTGTDPTGVGDTTDPTDTTDTTDATDDRSPDLRPGRGGSRGG